MTSPTYKYAANLPRLLDLLVFHLFRDKLSLIVNHYRTEEKVEDLKWKHIFLAPQNYSKRKSFTLKGISTPYIAVWPGSPLSWNKMFYGRSVLARPLDWYDSEGGYHKEVGFIYDVEADYAVTAASYFRSFCAEVNQEVLDLDRLRYIEQDLSMLIPGWRTKLEVELVNMTISDNVNQESDSRVFNFGASYKVRASLPVLSWQEYTENLQIFLKLGDDYTAEIAEINGTPVNKLGGVEVHEGEPFPKIPGVPSDMLPSYAYPPELAGASLSDLPEGAPASELAGASLSTLP